MNSLSHKIIKNTAYNSIGRFWTMLINLFLVPYIISRIGIERFGIWAVIGAMTGYFGLFDFGLGVSFVKYIAEFYTRKEYNKISQLLNTGFIFYSAFGSLVIALAFLLAGPVIGLFKIPPALHGEATVVFLIGIVLINVSNAFSLFSMVQLGLQRMDIYNKVMIAISIPSVVGTIFFLEHGYGLIGLMCNTAIVTLLISVINIGIASRLVPGLRLNPLLLTREMAGKLFSFGYKIQVSRVCDFIMFQMDRLIIGFFFNMSLVGFYQLGSGLAQQVRGVPLLLVSALLPLASEIDARQDREKLIELYMRGTKYLALVSMPLVFFVMATAPLIMHVWLGLGYARSVTVIQILSIGYLVNLMSGVGVSISVAIGRPELQMRSAVMAAALGVFLSVVFLKVIGFAGVALGVAIALMAGAAYFFRKFHQRLHLPLEVFLRKVILVPLAGSLVSAGIVYLLTLRVMTAPPTRVVGLFELGMAGIVCMVIYALVLVGGRYFDDYDAGLVREYLARLHIRKRTTR